MKFIMQKVPSRSESNRLLQNMLLKSLLMVKRIYEPLGISNLW